MSLLFIPKIVYTNGGTITVPFSIPQRLWTPVSKGEVGGMNVSAAGVPEAWETRRDEKCDITLRFYESEWAALQTFLLWAQRTCGSFSYYFDANRSVTGSPVTVYLDKPKMGEEIKPKRGDAKRTYELDITIRSTTSTPIQVIAYS